MTLASMLTQTVEVMGAGTPTEDAEGNSLPGPTTVRRIKARIEQNPRVGVTAAEGFAGAERSAQRWRLIVLPGDQPAADERVRYNGQVFEVIGPPFEEWTPRGPHQVVVDLRWVGE